MHANYFKADEMTGPGDEMRFDLQAIGPTGYDFMHINE